MHSVDEDGFELFGSPRAFRCICVYEQKARHTQQTSGKNPNTDEIRKFRKENVQPMSQGLSATYQHPTVR